MCSYFKFRARRKTLPSNKEAVQDAALSQWIVQKVVEICSHLCRTDPSTRPEWQPVRSRTLNLLRDCLFFSPDILQVELFFAVLTYCTGCWNSLWYVVNMPLVYSSQLQLPRVTGNYPWRYWVILKPVWFEMIKHLLISGTSNIWLGSIFAYSGEFLLLYLSVHVSVIIEL